MLNIDADPVFTVPVTVKLPDREAETFKATFRVLDVDRLADYALDTAAGARAFLVAAIVDLDEIESAGGQRLSYGEELRDRILARPDLRGALAGAYMKGVEEAARGNSDGPPAHG